MDHYRIINSNRFGPVKFTDEVDEGQIADTLYCPKCRIGLIDGLWYTKSPNIVLDFECNSCHTVWEEFNRPSECLSFSVRYNASTRLLHEKMDRAKDFWLIALKRAPSFEEIEVVLEAWKRNEIELSIPKSDWEYLSNLYGG